MNPEVLTRDVIFNENIESGTWSVDDIGIQDQPVIGPILTPKIWLIWVLKLVEITSIQDITPSITKFYHLVSNVTESSQTVTITAEVSDDISAYSKFMVGFTASGQILV